MFTALFRFSSWWRTFSIAGRVLVGIDAAT
jgi:hypothetical protein